jgi:hypothetical protein
MIKDPVPGHCPVCGRNVFQTIIKREIKDWEDPDLAWKWWCHGCNSWFTWDEHTRKVRGIETHFMRGSGVTYLYRRLMKER